VCNHVSFIDAVLLMAASPRPIRFIMDHRIFATPVLGWLFRWARPSRSRRSARTRCPTRRAFAEARQVLDDGDLLCIFPEGGITRDGSLGEFKGGVMKILQTHPVPVVPLALHQSVGLVLLARGAGHGDGAALPARLFSPVGLVAGPARARRRVAGGLKHARHIAPR
jgi:1-acyl-sn-glycerol-3-phosphate acyltransferase